MDITRVEITRPRGQANADNDSARLGVDLNATNNWGAVFEATLLSIDPVTGAGLIIKDDNKMYRVKIGDITKVTFETV